MLGCRRVFTMNIEELFFLALMPVLKTLLIAVVGLYLAMDHVSILTAEGRHHLNNVSWHETANASSFRVLKFQSGKSKWKIMQSDIIIYCWFLPVCFLVWMVMCWNVWLSWALNYLLVFTQKYMCELVVCYKLCCSGSPKMLLHVCQIL